VAGKLDAAAVLSALDRKQLDDCRGPLFELLQDLFLTVVQVVNEWSDLKVVTSILWPLLRSPRATVAGAGTVWVRN